MFTRIKLFLLLLLTTSVVTATEKANDKGSIVDSVFATGPIKSFMLQREGQLIIDAHRMGMRSDRTTNVKSVSKSIVSLLVGIAIDKGYLRGVDQPIGEFFTDYFNRHPDPVKEAITIKDLLTMRSGLASTSIRNYGRWVVSDNWIEYVLDQALVSRPGDQMIYSTGSSHLLSAIITRASGMSTRSFANRYLFGPLGIRDGGWDQDPQGYYFGGNNMALSPESMLRIGTMVMNNGTYDGQQVVPEAWIRESMQKYTRSRFNPYDYGYLWWQRELNGEQVQFAWGNGGQYIVMIPELDTVLAVASRNGGDRGKGRVNRQRFFAFIEDHLIDYLRQPAPLN